jgi:hypothetical protein
MVLKQNSVGKRPLGRRKLRWEDIVKRDIKNLGSGENWKDLAMNRDCWRIGCETGWFQRLINPRRRYKNKPFLYFL